MSAALPARTIATDAITVQAVEVFNAVLGELHRAESAGGDRVFAAEG